MDKDQRYVIDTRLPSPLYLLDGSEWKNKDAQ
jgi:hypothetical protein